MLAELTVAKYCAKDLAALQWLNVRRKAAFNDDECHPGYADVCVDHCSHLKSYVFMFSTALMNGQLFGTKSLTD